MPFEIIWERRGVLRRYVGHVTAQERRESFNAICADPRFDDLRYTITDYLAVTTYEITEADTREIAALHVGPLHTNPNIVIAAVVTDARIIAAIEDFIAHGFTRQPYRVFATEADARRWIDTTGHVLR